MAFVSTAATCQIPDYLNEFVEVTTRTHVDEELGFRVDYPYEWHPSSDPVGDADFYVGAPFAMPSFSVTVLEKPDAALADSIDLLDLSTYTNQDPLGVKQIRFAGFDALSVTVNWTTDDAGRHFIETKLISFYADGWWYVLRVNQTYRDNPWRTRLNAVLGSFELLEAAPS
ncbi:MAG: hypothetical protein F4W90_00390 [Gammaproteobacteria bacterium]|nr:hypothetical protein [Gammaproteobacteria bacterium]